MGIVCGRIPLTLQTNLKTLKSSKTYFGFSAKLPKRNALQLHSTHASNMYRQMWHSNSDGSMDTKTLSCPTSYRLPVVRICGSRSLKSEQLLLQRKMSKTMLQDPTAIILVVSAVF